MEGEVSTEKARRGGARAGAGRKRSKETWQDPKHEARPALDWRHPVHAILRTREDVPRLRQRCMFEAIRRSLVHYVGGEQFRVVHISIQHNHLHLITEAANEAALTEGMRSFAIRVAKAINRAWGREGKVFKFRYKAKQIRSREYARNAIAYVLNNWRRHREDFYDLGSRRAVLDEYSSAVSFAGWTSGRFAIPTTHIPLPVSPPRTSLLRTDWQWHGLIDPWEIPSLFSR
jgi:REP element-mobilizing transposase RayT